MADERAKARAALRKGRKVFLKHDHPRGFLNEHASWSGEYHLAYVQEGCDDYIDDVDVDGDGDDDDDDDESTATIRFKALWKRGGGSRGRGGRTAVVTRTLYPSGWGNDHVIPLDEDAMRSMVVQVEDDDNGNVHSAARIVDMCEDMPGMVRIRWDRGDEQTVCISQLSIGRRGRTRKRSATAVAAAAASAAVAGTATGTGTAARGRAPKRKRRAAAGTAAARRGKQQQRGARGRNRRRKAFGPRRGAEDIEVISILSSSSSEDEKEEEEMQDGRKRPSSSSSSSSPPKKGGGRKQPRDAGAGSESGGSPSIGADSSRKEVAKDRNSSREKDRDDDDDDDDKCNSGQGEDVDDGVDAEEGCANLEDAINDFLQTQDGMSEESRFSTLDMPSNSAGREGESTPGAEGVARGSLAASAADVAFVEGLLLAEGGTTGELRSDGRNDAASKSIPRQGSSSSTSMCSDRGEPSAATRNSTSLQGVITGSPALDYDSDEGSTASKEHVTEGLRRKSADGGADYKDDDDDNDDDYGDANYKDDDADAATTDSASCSPDERKAVSQKRTITPRKNASRSSSSDEREEMAAPSKKRAPRKRTAVSRNNTNSPRREIRKRKITPRKNVPCSASSDDREEMAAPPNKRASRKITVVPRKNAASSPSSEPSSDDDDEEETTTTSRAPRKRTVISRNNANRPRGELRKRKTTPRKNAPCSASSDDREEMSAPPNKGASKKRTVIPRKNAAISPSSEPSSDDDDEEEEATTASKKGGILLHGFCRSTTEMKKPSQMVKVVQNMLGKALQCKKDSATEFRETLVDANMMLQETLFNLNERTKFVKAPGGNSTRNKKCSGLPKNDGNKEIIVSLAKRFDLRRGQIDDLFSRLDTELGYYSINDAIPVMMEMVKDRNETSAESDDGEESSSGVAGDKEVDPKLDLLGSRVRTVLEDGREYAGTISTVHYRVTYDDGDTETFVSEAEAFENLACNDEVLNGALDDDMRCSMLELFSGCSVLSTVCKRKGMKAMSIDNDVLDSNASVKADFSSNYVQSLLSSQVFDYIHASPVCKTYSLLAGGKHRNRQNYNKTTESHEADAMLTSLYFYIEKALMMNGDATVTIENPRAWMKEGNIMKELFESKLGFKRFHINYCQFGRGDKKPTNIWTNDLKLGIILESIGNKCNCRLPHEDSIKRTVDKNFAALPLKLCQVISTYIQSKHAQLKFEKIASSHAAGCR